MKAGNYKDISFYYITHQCLHEKDTLAEHIKNDFVVNFLMTDTYDLCFKVDYKKQKSDIEKLQKIQKSILNESKNFDNAIQTFYREIPQIIFLAYDNCSKNVAFVCAKFKICSDIKNIILSYAINKTKYNNAKRHKRKSIN